MWRTRFCFSVDLICLGFLAFSLAIPGRVFGRVPAVPQKVQTAPAAIAYISKGDLYVRDLSHNAPPHRLTTDGLAHAPLWSPSGKCLAFLKGKQKPDGDGWIYKHVYVIHSDGTSLHRIPVSDGDSLAWSAGNALTFLDDHNRIMVYQPETEKVKCLVSEESKNGVRTDFICGYAWNHRGNSLVYATEWFGPQSRFGGSNRRLAIWRVDSSGKNRRVLFRTRGQSDFYFRGWSPNDRRVLFWAAPYDESADYVGSVPRSEFGLPLRDISTSGGGKARLLSNSEDVMCEKENVAFDPTGRYVAIVIGGGRFEYREPRRILRIDLATGARRWLTPASVHALRPVWSPDGREIVYCGCPQPQFSVDRAVDASDEELTPWIVDADGGHRRQLSPQSVEDAIAFLDRDRIVFGTDGKIAAVSTQGQKSLPANLAVIIASVDSSDEEHDSWSIWNRPASGN